MKSAWMNLRRHRYFVGPYSETPHITLVGPPPYYVLAEDCRPDELGRTIRVALGGSDKESVTEDDIVRLAQERTLALARLAGVKDRQTFERGARLVSFECVSADEILVTPNYRKRGYWEPAPEALWTVFCALRTPSWVLPRPRLPAVRRRSRSGDIPARWPIPLPVVARRIHP